MMFKVYFFKLKKQEMANMKKFFLFGSLMLLPQTGNAITTTIPAGTVSSGGDIMSIVTQNVYGEADNYTVFGTQQVMSGGKTNGSIIYSYGQQNVLSGGVSNNTTVQYYGMQNINGSSYNSSVDTRGTINVNRGGYAEGTIVNGGTYSVLSGASSSQTIVNSGREYVTGTEENATINGGTQEIKSGGIAENTTINNGGTQQVDEGGTAKETIISSGGSAVVYGTSTGTLVDSGAKFKIYGSGVAENTIISGGTMEVSGSGTSLSSQMISGIQRVYGLASGSSISGGTQTVYSGGKAENTKISGDGIQNVSYSGLAVSTNLYGGTQNINNGATAQNTVLSGGEMNVLSGGTATGTELNTGTEIVSGTDSGSIINGGLQQIASGGNAVSATINGGLQQIADGGKAVSTTINGGTQEIQEGGSSEGTVINTNGLQQVASGGVSDNTTINGGEMNVLSGGTATGTELNSGTEIVSGTDSGSIINGGLQQIADGGKAVSTTINGGTQSIYGGGISENPNVKGGNLRIYQGGTSINTTITQGSAELYTGGSLSGQTQISQGTLNIYGDNTIPTLILNDSMVNIPQSGGYSTLQIGELNGSGIFNLSSNFADDEFDSLEITNGTGNFGIIFHDYSSEGNLPTKIKIINKAGSANDDFYLIGDAVDVGAFQYKLLQEGNNWLLSRTQQLTDSSLIAKNTYTSLSSLFYTHLTPIYNRLHIAHPQNKHYNGLWIKAINRRIKFDYKDMTNSRMDVYGTAIGFDREAAISDGYIITLGAYGSYSYSRQKYNQRGHADGDTESLGLYASLTTPSLLSFDVVGSYYWHDQKIRSYTPSGSPVDGKFTNNGWQVSSYVSRRFDFGKQWYVSPIAGLRYMRIEGVNYHTNFNTPVRANASDFLSGSIGLSAGKRITLQSASILDAYGRFNLIHDWDGKSNVTVADYTFTEDVSTMRYELGAGLNFYNSEDSGAGYLDVSTQLGSKVRYPWEINVGWQYKF